MNGRQIFGILLIALGVYTYYRAISGAGFLGLTNPKWPGLASIGVGILFLTGVLK